MRKRLVRWLFLIAFIVASFLMLRVVLMRYSLGMPLLPALPQLVDMKVPLPHGYCLLQSASDVQLFDPSKSDVFASGMDEVSGVSVCAYRVYNDVIVGQVTQKTPPGSWYFILEYGGRPETGLDRDQWADRLHRYGIRSAPALHRPTGLDDLRGDNMPFAKGD